MSGHTDNNSNKIRCVYPKKFSFFVISKASVSIIVSGIFSYFLFKKKNSYLEEKALVKLPCVLALKNPKT